MQVIIGGRVGDSAGERASGRVEFAQAQRIDTVELLVTQSVAVAQVVNGELKTLAGKPFMLPSNPPGTAVRVREILGGRTFEWWTAVPAVDSVEYRALPVMESSSVPASVFGPPPWLAEAERVRDETVEALEEGIQVAVELGGLVGIQDKLAEAEASASTATAAASAAATSSTAAGTARTGAEAAKTAAEAARVAADGSKSAAAGSASAAATSSTDAGQFAASADSSKTAAAGSASAASMSATAAGTAKAGAEAAKAAAESARAAAETARTDAASAADHATAEANRAQAAADLIDTEVLEQELADMRVSIQGKADRTEVRDWIKEAAELGPNPFVAASTLYSYGHSYTMVPTPYGTPNQGEQVNILTKRMGFAKGVGRGRSGTPLTDTFSCMLAPEWGDAYMTQTLDRTWIPGTRGAVTLQNYMNEAGGGGMITQAWVDWWGLMLRSVFALLSAERIIPTTAATKTGTWQNFSASQPLSKAVYGGVVEFSNAAASTMTFTVPGDEVYLLLVASNAGIGGSKFDLAVNGVAHGSVTVDGIRPLYTSVIDEALSNRSPIAVRVSGLNAKAGTTGDKQLRLTVPAGATSFINGVIVPSSTPPLVFYGLEPPRDNANFIASDPLYRAKVAAVAPEFTNVTVADLADGYDTATMISSLDSSEIRPAFHPNDLGQLSQAAAYQRTMNDRITRLEPGLVIT